MFGLTPFETLMAGWALITTVIRAGEWVFQRNVDAGLFVKKADWEQGRSKDREDTRHFVRGEIGIYVRKDIYDRDWKDTNRRIEYLEGRPS